MPTNPCEKSSQNCWFLEGPRADDNGRSTYLLIGNSSSFMISWLFSSQSFVTFRGLVRHLKENAPSSGNKDPPDPTSDAAEVSFDLSTSPSNEERFYHQEFQVPKMEGFQITIFLAILGVGKLPPLHKPYPYSEHIGVSYLQFRYLKSLMILCFFFVRFWRNGWVGGGNLRHVDWQEGSNLRLKW